MTRKLFYLISILAAATLSHPVLAQVPTYGYGPGMGMGPQTGMMHPGMGMPRAGMGMMHPGMGMPHPGMGMMAPGMGLRGLEWRLNILDLSQEQREKIMGIFVEVGKRHWELMGKLWDEQKKLQSLHTADKLDAKAIGEAYSGLFDIKRQMIESMIEAHNQRLAVLTEEQRNKLEELRSQWGQMQGRGMGHGMMMR